MKLFFPTPGGLALLRSSPMLAFAQAPAACPSTNLLKVNSFAPWVISHGGCYYYPNTLGKRGTRP